MMTVSPTPLARQLVDALDVAAAELPPSTVDAVLRSTLQILGVARLGLANPITASGVDYVVTAERGSAATVISRGRVGTAAGAAFVNSLASHSDFREDTHAESQSHPGVVVIPAVLAVAEAAGGTLPPGRYAEAVVAGHELIGRLGRAGAIASTERGFRAPSLYTVFGGALAAAIALGLDREQRVHALAIAAQGAAGINQPFAEGTDDWFLAPAFAARHAVTSAMLAAAGVEGSACILDGTDGLFEAFAGYLPTVDVSAPIEYEIEHTRLKGALTCGFNQSLVYQLSQAAVPLDRLRAVDIRLSPGAAHYPGVASQGPYTSRTTALLSAPYATALQLVRGGLAQSGYTELGAADVLAITKLVNVTADESLEGYATQIELHLDGDETIRLEDGNDNPGFSLDTVQRVTDTLRRNYRSGGLDEKLVDGLTDGAHALLEGDTAPMSAALS